jgi:hypothetical protein
MNVAPWQESYVTLISLAGYSLPLLPACRRDDGDLFPLQTRSNAPRKCASREVSARVRRPIFSTRTRTRTSCSGVSGFLACDLLLCRVTRLVPLLWCSGVLLCLPPQGRLLKSHARLLIQFRGICRSCEGLRRSEPLFHTCGAKSNSCCPVPADRILRLSAAILCDQLCSAVGMPADSGTS